ncbi:MAG TPA: prephenate dehydratase domain-containing protein [Bacillota bacterium]|nr:prephenate dehydratase domain-containing protein [Bacillota bacterium]
MKLITLGPKGTFSEEAASLFQLRFPEEQNPLIEFSTIPGCLRAVERFEADRAIIPAENMVDGIIGTTFDALIDYHDSIKVCDEIHLSVDLVLAGDPKVKLDQIQTVLSHPSPLSQCVNNLTKILPSIVLNSVESTSVAAASVRGSDQKAAICSPKTARENGLKILMESICDFPNNETRFLVCGLSDAPPTGDDRTLLAVRFGANYPGQLHAITGIFSKRSIDLSFVQSRPNKIRPQDYVLLFELIGHRNTPIVEEALKEIEMLVRKTDGWKKVLGSFPHREKGV